MASSPHVTAGPTTALSSVPNSTHASTSNLLTVGALHGGPNMRLNFSLVSNPHTFSASSLPPLNTTGFLSPMVPPSPRSPMSSARSSMARPTRYRTSSNPSPLLIAATSGAAAASGNSVGTEGKLSKPPFVRKGLYHGSGHGFSAHGIADSEHDGLERMQPIAAPLRTQEIMLFYLATLLRTLAVDTYKVSLPVAVPTLVSYHQFP